MTAFDSSSAPPLPTLPPAIGAPAPRYAAHRSEHEWTPLEPVGPVAGPSAKATLVALGIGAVLLISGLLASWWLPRPSWDPRLEPYVAFVEEARGYEFDHPVDVRQIDLAESLSADWESQEDEIGAEQWDAYWNPWIESYRMLGLHDPAVDLGQATNDTAVANAAAYYDPIDETIMLPPGEIDIVMAEAIVHELTHALQHQQGMLDYPYESADGAYLRTALIEGDANRIASAWLGSRSLAEVEQHWRIVESREYEPGTDDFLTASFYAPYALGEPMVEVLVETEGVDRLDALLRSKSLGSSERLIDVLSPSPSPTVNATLAMTDPDGNKGVDGDLGPIVWFQALAPHIGVPDALDAMVGFDNDGFIAYAGTGDTTCVQYRVWFDTLPDAAEFEAAVRGLGVAEGAVTTDGSSVELALCEPVGDPGVQNSDVLLPLVWANWLADHHLRTGLSIEESRCASLAHARTIGLESPNLQWDTVLVDSERFVEACT